MNLNDKRNGDWLHRAIVENISEAVIMIDRQGFIIYFSPAAEKIFEYSCEDVIGKNVSLLMAEDQKNTHDRYIERYFQTGESRIMGRGRDIEGRTRSGLILHLNLHLSRLKIDDEDCFIGVMRDVGQRKVAETRLSRSLQEKDALNELLMIGTIKAGLDEKMRRGLNLLLSLPWLQLRDQGAIFVCDDASGNSLSLIASQGQTEAFGVMCGRVDQGSCLCGNAALKGKLVVAPRMDHPDDEFCCFRNLSEHTPYAWPIASHGIVQGVLLVYLPARIPVRPENLEFLESATEILALTIDRDEREQALSDAIAQSERANRSKSSFLSNLSHELRTPLHAVIGFSRLLLARRDDLSGDQIGHLQHIEQAGDYLLSIVNDLIELSTIEGGDKNLDPQLADLQDIFSRMTESWREENPDHSFQLILAPGLPMLTIDERALRRVLNNLLSNAVKFSSGNTVITLSAEQKEDRSLHIRVSDQGKGMRPGDIPRALQPFQQLQEGYDRAKGGTGVGLAIAKSLVTLSGGRLEIRSEPDQGTTVELVFPHDLLTPAG